MIVKVTINQPKVNNKVTNSAFGRFVANEWGRLLAPYTPKDTGLLMQSKEIKPFELHYIEPYSAYVYFGEKYVDPVYGVSGWLGSEGWFSRPGVQKIPSGEKLEYQKNNPYATNHWDEVAVKNGQLDKLYRVINSGIRNGIY